MKILDKDFRLYIDNQTLEHRCAELAVQIESDYSDKDPLFVVILNGAFMFASSLIMNLNIPCQVSFVKISSYQNMNSTGKIKSLLGLDEQVAGRHLLVIDDIVDTGNTMEYMMAELSKQLPASVEVISMLLKPEAFHKGFAIKYLGFSIPNKFVVGYGLDYNGYGRNLKDLYQLAEHKLPGE